MLGYHPAPSSAGRSRGRPAPRLNANWWVAQEVASNQILAQVCAGYAAAAGDGGAVYNYRFSASQVSTLDLSPSLSGQAALARVTWADSWWPSS